MKRLHWKRLIVILSLGFMGWLLINQWRHVHAIDLEVRPGILTISMVALVALFFLDAYGWHLTLRALGNHPPASESIRIWMVSSLARYLPGGVWGYLSRASLCSELGIPLVSSSLSLYLETLLLMASSLAVGSPALLAATGLMLTPWTAGLIWLAVSFLMHPKVIVLTRHLPGRPGRLIAAAKLPSTMHILGLYLYYLVFWIVFGAVFIGFVFAIHPLPIQAWIPVGASLGLSFLIGFLVVIIPGGIGIRESALYLLLLPFMPPTACLLVSVGSRFWIMVCEGISILLAVVLFKRRVNVRQPTRSSLQSRA